MGDKYGWLHEAPYHTYKPILPIPTNLGHIANNALGI